MKPRADLARQLADALATVATIARKLATLEAADAGTDGEDYDSRLRLPPDMPSRDRFRRTVKLCPGARRIGHVWVVPREAWKVFRCKRSAVPAPPPVLEAASKYDDLYTPSEALAAVGSRRVAGSH
ncbi:MAG TPA: hypothetical protein VF316_04125 [Polyangiaceae bacterium]